jgi:4-hydroxy-tetrahydrodipicolinate synthase
MQTLTSIRGIVCPIVTPFDAQDRIDHGAMCQVIDFLLSHGVHAIMLGGTTGEGMMLSLEERESLCEVAVEHVAGRAPVIAHTGCISTADTICLTDHAESVGATAASVIVPYYYTFDDDSLFNHFVSVAKAVPNLPIFLYTFPGSAKNDISAALLRRLRHAAPNIVGIKSSNTDLLRFQEYVEVGGEGFTPLSGVDGLMLPALAVGALGQVSGNANPFPEPFCALYDAFVAGDMELAGTQQQLINRIRLVLKDGVCPAFLKAALALRGIPAGRVRPPMRELTPGEWQEMEQGIRELGLI